MVLSSPHTQNPAFHNGNPPLLSGQSAESPFLTLLLLHLQTFPPAHSTSLSTAQNAFLFCQTNELSPSRYALPSCSEFLPSLKALWQSFHPVLFFNNSNCVKSQTDLRKECPSLESEDLSSSPTARWMTSGKPFSEKPVPYLANGTMQDGTAENKLGEL